MPEFQAPDMSRCCGFAFVRLSAMLSHMKRTTLQLDASLVAELRRRAATEGRTLTEVLDRTLRAGLAAPAESRRARVAPPPSPPLRPGPVPRGSPPPGPPPPPGGGRGGGGVPVIAVDTGLLVLAVNRHTPEHARAATLLESLAHGGAEWALPWSAVHEFLAFVTHPHAVAHVLGPEDAWGFIESLAASSSLSFLGTTARDAGGAA